MLALSATAITRGSEPAVSPSGHTKSVVTDTGGASPATFQYAKRITIIIKQAWAQRVESRIDLTYGVTVIHIAIRADGHINTPKILSNSSGKTMADLVVNMLTATQLPAMPPDVASDLHGKRLALDVTFDLQPFPGKIEPHR